MNYRPPLFLQSGALVSVILLHAGLPGRSVALDAPGTPARNFQLLRELPEFKTATKKGPHCEPRLVQAEQGPSLEIRYGLRRGQSARSTADVNVNLARCERLRLLFQGGTPDQSFSFQIEDIDGSSVGVSWPGRPNPSDWTAMEVPLSEMAHLARGRDGFMDWTRVRAIHVLATNSPDIRGCNGLVTFREIKIY